MEIVDRHIEPTPKLVEAFRRIVIADGWDSTPWIAADQPAYKQTDRHWCNWKDSLYF
jgi:hypothetical protein